MNRTKHHKRNKGRMIADLEMPSDENPISVMQNLVQEKYNQFSNCNIIDNNTYQKFVHLLAAALYLGPMGRYLLIISLFINTKSTSYLTGFKHFKI